MQLRQTVILSLFVTIAGVLHAVEGWLPLPLPVPGVKIGLANIISLIVMVIYGWRSTIYVVLLRVLLGALLSGAFIGITLAMSLSGAILSAVVMLFAFRWFTPSFSLVGISVIGALAHSITQIFVACILVATPGLLWYIPYLMLVAVPTGVATGFTASYFLAKTSGFKF